MLRPHSSLFASARRFCRAAPAVVALALCWSLNATSAVIASTPETSQAAAGASATANTAIDPALLASMLPATVYFQGKTAPLQLRNAGAVRLFGSNAVVWAALVDSSGYASAVQERYQFYLVTETALQVGSQTLTAGAYGGGFLGDKFLLMDIGGKTVLQGDVQTEPDLKRPRPLQLLPAEAGTVRLYLGRRFLSLKPAP